jgi:tRNA pseudouridine38-40 synthase
VGGRRPTAQGRGAQRSSDRRSPLRVEQLALAGRRPALRTVRLLIEYDGTDYSGWQAQANGPSIQETIEAAIFKITAEKLRIAGSGRTDAGVHALGQVATFTTESDIPPERFAPALNGHLPEDISILCSEQVPETFHARKSALGKTYRYRIFNRRGRPALLRDKVYHFVPKLDLEAMRCAAAHMAGRHDFRAFTPTSSERPAGYEREVYSLDLRRDDQEVVIEVSGSGFLYNMVRIIAGTLIEVGRGRLASEELPGIIASRDRRRAGPTAAACGLYLVCVDYGESQPST